MKSTNNTVLITGGSAGIGLEMAKLFAAGGNQVIITGRNAERLQKAADSIPGVTAIPFDVTRQQDVDALAERLQKDFPTLNLLINNAGQAFVYNPATSTDGFEKAGAEMLTNYLSVIRLTEKLLPLLHKQPEAAIVNVTSIVAFVPGSRLSTYAASKAALHSYSQSLRIALGDTKVKVFELMPPLVDTEFSKEIDGHNGIPPQKVASDLLEALAKDEYEIHVGGTADLYRLFLSSPAQALQVMNPVA